MLELLDQGKGCVMIREGKIVSITPQGVTVHIPFDPAIVAHECRDVHVFLPDGRELSPDQRRKAWALVGEIAAYSGYAPREKEDVNAIMKSKFLRERADELTAQAIQKFSLSDVDMETASLYISYLVDFVLENDIPTHQPILDLCEDVKQAVYSALMHKRCIVCGKPATLHHVDAVGMGRNRDEICHIGMRALPLCWNEDGSGHHQEAHRIGDAAMMDKYHLDPVAIDERIARKYRLGKCVGGHKR